MKQYFFIFFMACFISAAQAEDLLRYDLNADNIASWKVSNKSITVNLVDAVREAFYDLTEKNFGRELEIHIDGKLVFSPVIRASIPSGVIAFDNKPELLSALNVCCQRLRILVNAYTQENFVANKDKYAPTLMVDEKMVNAWGIAIRPKGAGGHFWVTAKDTSIEYVGDVKKSANPTLQNLHQDDLKAMTLPVGGEENFATGIVFSNSTEDFVITQDVAGKPPITAPAKFLFASDGGIISAWTERKNADGSFDRAAEAITVVDQSSEGAQFFGLAISHDYSRLYAADFGLRPSIKVFNGEFKPLDINFDQPFDDNKNGIVDPGEYAPFNIQALQTPRGENHLFATYAKTQICPAEEVAKKTCAEGALFVGEEDTKNPGSGRLAEFNEDGKLVAVWQDGGKLSAPWGMAFAPADFGALSGMMLVANFGDGTIAGYDVETRGFKDVMRDEKGNSIKIDKVWGILFGNGESLGDSNALYYAAGPEDEADGIFGALRVK